MMLFYIVIAILIFLLSPSDAFAWGPGMHMYLGLTALAKLALAAPAIRSLMEKYPEEFLYGTVVPDVVVGKKYAGYMHHCHNWDIGRLILKEAATQKQRAAAYGYLMHLAADVVAHNYYIPFKMIKSYETRMLSHTYWEMRFDIGVPEKAWRQIDKVSKSEMGEFDLLLERVLKKTIFSYRVNKRIFSSILIFQKMKGMRDSLRLYAKRSRWEVGEENRQHYVDLTLEAVFDFLAHPDSAPCLEIDPTGVARLQYAKDLRRRIKMLVGRGALTRRAAAQLIELAKERLAVGLYRPNLILPDVTDVL
jgi:hypothetical protein